MPARSEVQARINHLRKSAQDIVRCEYLKALHDYTKRDVIVYASGSFSSAKRQPPVPGWVMSINLEDIQGFMAACHKLTGKQLDLVIHSPGGSAEAAEQIVNYLRARYDHIRAVIPQSAMSAATMLACGCDEIVMGKESALGPIDPQLTIPTPNGQMVIAAHALISEFEKAKTEVKGDVNLAHVWSTKIRAYPPGILSVCETATSHARDKVEGWLSRYMLKDVADRQQRAKDIAKWLADADTHKSHAHPISYEMANEKGLNVKLLEDDKPLQEHVLSLFHATMITLETTHVAKFVENQHGKGWFMQVNAK
jgi:hypothetical protein